MEYTLEKVIFNEHIQSEYYRIGLTGGNQYQKAAPGQFVTLRFENQISPLLPRPFSIHRIASEDGVIQGIEVLYKVVGGFTGQLTELKPGDRIHLLGPIGNAFKVPADAEKIFMIAGGVGVAPMLFLTDFIKNKGLDLNTCTLFLGGRSISDLLLREKFSEHGINLSISTDDGSLGTKGFITELLEIHMGQNQPAVLYACGPMVMLKKVAEIAEKFGTPCQISIETMMACGMGACLGCAMESAEDTGGYLHACRNGPVFNSQDLKL